MPSSILPFWPRRPWFPLLLQMAASPPISLAPKERPIDTGTVDPSEFREAATSGLALEWDRVRSWGLSGKVITTLLRARKASTNTVYQSLGKIPKICYKTGLLSINSGGQACARLLAISARQAWPTILSRYKCLH